MTVSDSGNYLNSLATSMSDIRNKRAQASERLASAGAEAPWSKKTSAQIDANISATNKIGRLEEFQRSNKLLEGRLRTQLIVLDDFIKLAREIQNEFMPGSYTLGGVRPGLSVMQQNYINRFFQIGNRIDPISGEYAMGGIATQTTPIQSFPSPGSGDGLAEGSQIIHTAREYSTPVDGSVTVYINDEGDTISISGSDFANEIVDLYTAIFQLCNSVTGSDAASDQASASAAIAQKNMLSAYYQKLEQINTIIDEDNDLSELIGEAIKLREDVTEDKVEDLLSTVTSLSVMEDIRQHLFAQETRRIQAVADMLKQG